MQETNMLFGVGILDKIKTQLQSEDEIGRGVLGLICTPGLLTLKHFCKSLNTLVPGIMQTTNVCEAGRKFGWNSK